MGFKASIVWREPSKHGREQCPGAGGMPSACPWCSPWVLQRQELLNIQDPFPSLLMFLEGMVVEHQINNCAHPSTAKLVPIQSSHSIRSKQEVPWGGEGGGKK